MRLVRASNSYLSVNPMYLGYKHKPIRAHIIHTLLSHGKWCLASKISFMESEEEGTREVGERSRKKNTSLNPLMSPKVISDERSIILSPNPFHTLKIEAKYHPRWLSSRRWFSMNLKQKLKANDSGYPCGHNCKAFPPLYFFKDAHTECHPKLSLRDFNLTQIKEEK